ncbi:hypothetical protein R3398_01265 [Rossellomorea marisflavi]|uniref:hypothetical protein n=1 Tax=Rossellomorea marisflavi TaxID=189381 RepID=UPI00296E7B64|nr:hypothetical protein [Rossellomorea marisflavi]MDW4524995.1 hypothetical protein [Rossellomorea marisflavi]
MIIETLLSSNNLDSDFVPPGRLAFAVKETTAYPLTQIGKDRRPLRYEYFELLNNNTKSHEDGAFIRKVRIIHFFKEPAGVLR